VYEETDTVHQVIVLGETLIDPFCVIFFLNNFFIFYVTLNR